MNKRNIFCMYDMQHKTWKIMSTENECLYFGDIDGLENWLSENDGTYTEEFRQ